MLTFEDYLKSCRIQAKYLPYYVHWQIQYINYCNHSGLQPNDRTILDQYLSVLSRQYEPWQVEQAGESIRFYYVYLSLNEKKLFDGSDNKLAWKRAVTPQWRELGNCATNLF